VAMKRVWGARAWVASAGVAWACSAGLAWAQLSPAEPEAASGLKAKVQVQAREAMVVAAHPLASQAGLDILKAGGSAVDAAIAVQFMLSLVEPQSSGVGGGLFLLHRNPAGELFALDGREVAPAAAHADWFVENGQVMGWLQAASGGKAVGVPGAVRALHEAHRKWGRLPWAQLLQPAIRAAEEGFKVGPRLHALLKGKDHPSLMRLSPAKEYFYPEGEPLPVGFVRRNPEYAQLLRALAKRGEAAFYEGEHARRLVQAVNEAAINPGRMSESDLAAYRVLERAPLCTPYRQWRVCGMGPPSSGGVAVAQMLGLVEPLDLAGQGPNSVQSLHWLSQAGRLAFADRERYLADPAFVEVPTAGLLEADYLQQRAALMPPERDAGAAKPGTPKGAPTLPDGRSLEKDSTSHVSVLDRWGGAVSMTTSVEGAFGSGVMVDGYLLNNHMTDFSLSPDPNRPGAANRVAPGKRPRSSMSPTLVLNAKGELHAVLGSPGGSRIISYVFHALVGLLDWNLEAQAVADAPRFSHRNDALALEAATPLLALKPELEARGYRVLSGPMTSGLHLIVRCGSQWCAGVDPRREGLALGW
jgi:gamma-glutamyltranspeptidase/glutathione hydrolase